MNETTDRNVAVILKAAVDMHVIFVVPFVANKIKWTMKNGWTNKPTPRSDMANPISNMFAGVRSERERHIDIMTSALASVATMEKGTFTAAFTKEAVLKGAFPTAVL